MSGGNIYVWMWMLGHVFSAGFLLSGPRRTVAVCALLCLLPIYLSGKLVGDIAASYLFSLNDLEGTHFEIGFIRLQELFILFVTSSEKIMFATQGVTAALALTAFMLWKGDNLPIVVVAFALLTLFVFLGTQNVLRQGIATSIILIALYFVGQRRWVITVGLVLAAQLFHDTSILFCTVLAFAVMLKRIGFDHSWKLSGKRPGEGLRLASGVTAAKLLLLVLALLGPLLVTFYFFTEYFLLAQRVNERFLGFLKPALVTVLFLVTNVLWSRRDGDYWDDILLISRATFFAIFLAMSLHPALVEAASRILFFYFALEGLAGLRFIAPGVRFNQKLGSVLVLLSYGIAPNAIVLLEQMGDGP